MTKTLARAAASLAAAALACAFAFAADAAPIVAKPMPAKTAGATVPAKAAPFDAKDCYECHDQVKAMHTAGGHRKVGCPTCHEGLDKHAQDQDFRPVTKTDPAVCGGCHKNQFETMYTMNWDKPARAEKSRYQGSSPNPSWDKLMAPHGFTKEHNTPRSHAFALYDQLVVDRAFGGRYVNKDGWEGLAAAGGNFGIWDVLVDQYPGQEHKAFKPGTAAAANPVCMSCKTADHILDWAYLGDPAPNAKWSRTSKVQEFVKDTNHSLSCFFCHDPHSAKPRIIRDALIQALTRPAKDTLWHKDPKGAKIDVKDMGERGFTRKIALLSRYDTNLQCGQCHVEYNCNPGTDPKTGQPVTMADQRTNHFPFKKVGDIGQHYTDLGFRDFKHGITGALLWKGQHPDTETYYGSVHQKAGVECSDCHMPKVKDAKTGKTFTSHWQTSPRHYLNETCLACHKTWTAQQAVYTIDSMKGRYDGKVRKAEYWLTRFIDKFEEAQNLGVDPAVLAEARRKHDDAHINWEWWTAVNGAYFHNPDEATESLNKSMTYAQEGIKLLDDAMAKKRGETKTVAAAPPAAAPAPAPAK